MSFSLIRILDGNLVISILYFLKVSFTNSTNLTINSAYDNHSGIDFDTVYSDYNFILSRTN